METIQLAPNFSICRILNGMWQVAGGHGQINHDSAISQMLQYNETVLHRLYQRSSFSLTVLCNARQLI